MQTEAPTQVPTKTPGILSSGPLPKGTEITPTGLRLPDDLEFDQWKYVGETLLSLNNWTPWAIGDWLNHGERIYGETYTQAAEVTGKAIKTLYNHSWRAAKVKPDVRSEILSPKHHEVVASMPPDDQEWWLRAGEEQQKEHEKNGGRFTVQNFSDLVASSRTNTSSAETATTITCPECKGRCVCIRCDGHGEIVANEKPNEKAPR